jgi:hypothetical protein
MRAILITLLAAIVVGSYTDSLSAAADGSSVQQNATPLTQFTQDYYGYRPACQYSYYYTCWTDPNGTTHCGCRPGFGYYLFRFYRG